MMFQTCWPPDRDIDPAGDHWKYGQGIQGVASVTIRYPGSALTLRCLPCAEAFQRTQCAASIRQRWICGRRLFLF